MKPYFSKDFVSLLNGLLEPNVRRRMTLAGAKAHPFFKSVKWDDVTGLKQKPTYKPVIKKEGDINNVDKAIKSIDIMGVSLDSSMRSNVLN